MTDAAAGQMAEGGFNVVWCTEKELDVAHRHGLRAQLQDGLLAPATLDSPALRNKLDALIEPRAAGTRPFTATSSPTSPAPPAFAGLGKLVAYLRQRDPDHLAYINLFPTYASNEQLGTKGDVVTAYREHLRQYLETVEAGASELRPLPIRQGWRYRPVLPEPGDDPQGRTGLGRAVLEHRAGVYVDAFNARAAPIE